MLEFIDKVNNSISTYRSQDYQRNIFTEISDAFYRENYHSDIFAYYFSFEIVKKVLIDWISKSLKNPDIKYGDYHDGEVKREDARIDITIYSCDRKKAIIIENKSNNASDQDRQLPRYLNELTKRDIQIDGILYLNKNHMKEPDTTGWSKNEYSKIEKMIVISQLVGVNSFISNVIDQVLVKTTDIRLCALSHEIKCLLLNIVYGGLNMEDLYPFVQELSVNGNLEKLQKAIQAYKDLPKYWREYYKKYLDSEKLNGRIDKNIRIGTYKETCLFVDNIVIGNIDYGFDIWFNQEYFDFSILTRNGSENDIDELRKKMNEKWFFTDNVEFGRYRFSYKEILNEKAIKELILKAIDSFNPFI